MAQPPQWLSSGIGGGSALFYPSISPHDNQVMYAASDLSGMFVTKDGGENWEIVPFQELIATTESKVNFTSDPNILYTVCRDFIADLDYICKSIDGGASWQRKEIPILDGEVEYLYADPQATDRLVVSTYDQLFYSTDGGENFILKYTAETDAGLHIGGVFWDAADIYIGSTDGLLQSTDNGVSFEKNQVNGLPANFGFLSFCGTKQGDELRFFSVARDKFDTYPGIWGTDYWDEESKFFCVEKSGTNFQTMDEGFDFTSNNFPFFVAAADNDLNTVFVAGSRLAANGSAVPSIWKSTNGGQSWDYVLQTENNGNIATGYMGKGGVLDWQWSENAMGFAVAPNDPQRAVITDFSFLHLTTDGGESWQATYVPPAERNQAGSLTPIEKSYTSNGLENTSIWNLYWANADDLFAATTDLTGLRSTNGGTSWTLEYNGLDYFDEDDFSQKRFNTVYQISEHPENGVWYAAASTLHDIYQTHILTDNELDGFNELGSIWQSTDAGENWTLIQEFEQLSILQT
ncbi:MAG: WD40/YVTN/BNR-like repeat-containing protein, partial [Saprospiraceae bacterium]